MATSDGGTEREHLVRLLSELIDPVTVRDTQAEMSLAELRGLVARCRKQEARYEAAGFVDAGRA